MSELWLLEAGGGGGGSFSGFLTWRKNRSFQIKMSKWNLQMLTVLL